MILVKMMRVTLGTFPPPPFHLASATPWTVMLGAKSPLMRERKTEVITTNFSHPPTGRFKLLQQQIQSRTETFADRAENETAWSIHRSFLFVNEILFGVHRLTAVKIEDRHM